MTNLFLDTLAGRASPGDPPPVWFMRQAGRYLPEYRALRETHSFLQLMTTPEAAAEATLQPVRRYGVDAAIIFSDIMAPLYGAGIGLDFTPGPKLAEPLRDRAGLQRLRPLDPAHDTPWLLDALRAVRRELAPEKTALIGFAGAPLTLAAYLIEGSGSKDHFETARARLLGDPVFARELMDRLAEMTVDYLLAQAEAGAQAVQLFESWAAILGREDYARIALPAVRTIIERVAPKVPLIFFPNDGAHLLELLAGLPAHALSCDWRLPLSEVGTRTGGRFVLQGNLDPALLLTDPAAIREGVLAIRRDALALPRGFILNLGHGISRHTPLENAGAFVAAAREPLA